MAKISRAPVVDEDDSDPLRDASWLFSYADLMTQLLLFIILTVTLAGIKDIGPESADPAESSRVRLTATQRDLERYASQAGLTEAMAIDVSADRVTIRLENVLLFARGTAQLTEPAHRVLEGLADRLRNEALHMRVEGHTDDVPIHTAQFPSNWELSTARAIAVVEFFEAHGIAATRLSAAGYGEYKPIAANDDEERRALNRRVEIVVHTR